MGKLNLVLAAAALLMVACASRATQRDTDFDNAPHEVHTDWELTKERCSQCHTPDYVLNDMHLYESRQSLEYLVKEMAEIRGSRIQGHEIPRIVNALDWHRTNH